MARAMVSEIIKGRGGPERPAHPMGKYLVEHDPSPSLDYGLLWAEVWLMISTPQLLLAGRGHSNSGPFKMKLFKSTQSSPGNQREWFLLISTGLLIQLQEITDFSKYIDLIF